MLKASCASKMALGWPLNDSRPMVCCCNSSTPLEPCSLAGSKISATARVILWTAWRRASTRARAIAAPLAITCTDLAGTVYPAGSIMGARNRACGASSRACVRSIRCACGASFRAFSVDSADPARKITSAPSTLASSNGARIAGSPPFSVSLPTCSPSAAISLRSCPKVLPESRSRISRPARDSLPTRASTPVLANLVLRLFGWRGTHVPPPENAAQSYHDAAGDIARGARNQHRLRIIPDESDQDPDQNDGQRGPRPHQADVLETVIAPGAHHEEGKQRQQRQPGDGERPKGDGLRIRRVDHRSHHAGRRRDRQAHEVFAVGSARVLGDGIFLYVKAGQARGTAQQVQEGHEASQSQDLVRQLSPQAG